MFERLHLADRIVFFCFGQDWNPISAFELDAEYPSRLCGETVMYTIGKVLVSLKS